MRLSVFKSGLVVLLLALVTAGVTASAGQTKVVMPIKKCAKVKKKAAKRACLKHNKMVRQVFNTVKDSRYVYTQFNGTAIDAIFCANGKWKVVAVPLGEALTFSGKRWKLESPGLNKRVLAADLMGPSNNIHSRVYVQRRGKDWVNSSQSPMTSAPPLTKTSAKKECRTLKV